MQQHRFLTIVAVAIFTLVFCQVLLENFLDDDLDSFPALYRDEDFAALFKEVTQPVVLWWAPLGGSYVRGSVTQCGQLSCYFTRNRNFQHHPLIKAFIFYGSSIKLTDLPLPRNRSQLWALLHEESPRNVAALSHAAAISLFNHTATFSRHSSYPITTQYLENLHVLTYKRYFLPVEEKTRLQEEEGLAPVMFVQSDCSTTLDRDSYVAELMKHIKVDSYGACLHNKDLPLHLQPPHSLETMMSEDMLYLVAKYKFAVAIENGVCEDYITEKLWRPLISGSVPVYIGSPSVSDWLPNNKSAVLGAEFSSPKQLAKFLHYLNTNDEAYNAYLQHKLETKIANKLLTKTVEEREWGVGLNSGKDDLVNTFACFVCRKAHNQKEMSIATTDHYNCPVPESALSKAPNTSNFWLDSWFYGKCEAKVVRNFVDAGRTSFTEQEFEDALKELVKKGNCQYSAENEVLS